MMRSLFAGVTGLKTHQTRMDVVGNNIANVNTLGYKTAGANFQDLVYQNRSSASVANNSRAGVNATQIGLGVSLASIYSNLTTSGAPETTDRPFDIRLADDSFFVVKNGIQTYYTRSGAFTVDGYGTLCMTSNGYKVQGYGTQTDEVTGNVSLSSSVGDLDVMSTKNMTCDPKATSNAYMKGILDKNDTSLSSNEGRVISTPIYDNEGYEYTVQYSIKEAKDANGDTIAGQYTVSVTDILDPEGKSLYTATGNSSDVEAAKTAWFKAQNWFLTYTQKADGTFTENAPANSFTINFDTETGSVIAGESGSEVYNSATATVSSEDLTSGVGFTLNLNGLLGSSGKAVAPAATTGVTDPEITMNDSFTSNIVYDLSKLYNVDNEGVSTTSSGNGGTDDTEGSGWKMGTLSEVSISVDGRVNGVYTNGQTKLLGQIVTATFANASGLQKDGDNIYSKTLNSGEPTVAGSGTMNTGQLEMSNVDLSSEFTTMITTQRGFQANSRIITVSDSMLEELVNLKR